MLSEVLTSVVLPPRNGAIYARAGEHIHVSIAIQVRSKNGVGPIEVVPDEVLNEVRRRSPGILPPAYLVVVVSSSENIEVAVSIDITGVDRPGAIEVIVNIVASEELWTRRGGQGWHRDQKRSDQEPSRHWLPPLLSYRQRLMPARMKYCV